MPGDIAIVERLAARTWATVVVPWRWRHLGTMAIRTLVIDGTAAGWRLARRARHLDMIVEPFPFRLVELRDPQGLSLRLRLAYRDVVGVQRAVLDDPAVRAARAEPLGPSWPAFLAKRIVTMDAMAAPTWWRAMLLIQACAWHVRTREPAGTRGVLFLDRRPCARALERYAAEAGVTLVWCPPAWSPRRWAREQLPPSARARLHRLERRILARRRGVRLAPLAGEEEWRRPGPPKLLVEHSGRLNFNRPEHYSDLFFCDGGTLDPTQVTMLFSLPHAPLDDAAREQLAEHGIGAIVTEPEAAACAAARMGAYLQWLLDGLREGRGRDRALAHAAQRYADAWGADKLRAINAPERGPAAGAALKLEPAWRS
jgi:hypothetical protein